MILRVAAICAAVLWSLPVEAQLPSLSNPVITLTAQAAGTVNSVAETNLSGGAVTCVLNQSSHTGSPSSTLSIQAQDPGGSGLFYNLITSAAIVADATPTAVSAGKGVQTTANVSASLPVPTRWRAQVVVGGTTPAVTGTVGCVVN